MQHGSSNNSLILVLEAIHTVLAPWGCAGAHTQISAESQHPAHKKSNGGSHLSARHQKFRFNLIWTFFEWLEHEILKNSSFLKKYRVPFFKNPHKNVFWKCPPFARFYFFKNHQKKEFEKIQIFEQLPKSKSPLLAIYKIIWHIWQPRSRKVNNDEPDLRFFHGNFWPVISHAVRNPCFSTSIPRGPNPGFPDAAGAAGRILKSRSRPLPPHTGMKYFREGTLAVDRKP